VGAALHIETSLYREMVNVEAAFRNIHQDLINGCKSGDQKAQFSIYKLYYKAMFNTSLRIVNDTMEAEDIMQESFLSAFEKIETYSGCKFRSMA
jgi:DNA-directed RNA polymerase specialized sigma24 family protein